MTEGEALVLIRGYASAGRIRITPHASLRMRQRGASFADVRHGLITAPTCLWQSLERSWRVNTSDLDGDALTIIVAIEGEDVVVTLF